MLTGVAAAVSAAIDYPAPANSTSDSTLDQLSSGQQLGDQETNRIDVEAKLTATAHDPMNARALCYTLLLAPNTSLVYDQQLDLIKQFCGEGLYQSVNQLTPLVVLLNESKRLPMIDKAIPALKLLSEDQYTDFKQLLVKLVQADGKIDLFEWCLYRMILQYLNPTFNKAKAVKAKHGNATVSYTHLRAHET